MLINGMRPCLQNHHRVKRPPLSKSRCWLPVLPVSMWLDTVPAHAGVGHAQQLCMVIWPTGQCLLMLFGMTIVRSHHKPANSLNSTHKCLCVGSWHVTVLPCSKRAFWGPVGHPGSTASLVSKKSAAGHKPMFTSLLPRLCTLQSCSLRCAAALNTMTHGTLAEAAFLSLWKKSLTGHRATKTDNRY